MEDLKSCANPVTVPIASVKAHTEVVTDRIVAVTTCACPFKPRVTAYEKMAKSFLLERAHALRPTTMIVEAGIGNR